ncbi:MAG: M23 family metallopeptidase [Burkholderiales bacterium]
MKSRSRLCALLLGGLLAYGGGEPGDPLTVAPAQSASPSPNDDAHDPAEADAAAVESLATTSPDNDSVQSTLVTMRIDNVPISVKGSDGRYHVVYELDLANFTADNVNIRRLDVLDARNGTTVATLDALEIGKRLVIRDKAAVPGRLRAAQGGILYLHLAFDSRGSIPRVLDHRLAAVRKGETVSATAARIRVARPTDLVFDSPLRGPRFIAGDGCCDSTRHVRATLAVNGRPFTAQRFAIDWEQLDEQGRIYVGDPKQPASYIIYGKPAYAVADARVIKVVDGLPDTPIGSFPDDIPLEQADGNHVVLDLGDGRYALYAHFKPWSVRVHEGEFVRRGQVLGQVGTSGNSSEPHLHFHVTDGPSPLLSNGVPYQLRRFSATRRGVSTAAFDKAIIDGRPLPTEPVPGPARREQVMPLDLWIVDFPQ